VNTLTKRMPVPVAIDIALDRLPIAVEATAYFVVAADIPITDERSTAGSTARR
jgi:hypothetical protein